MEENKQDPIHKELLEKDTPQLVALLKEMKEGLDAVRSKIELLTAKVKENNYPTADGISYLEAKNLLLLSYCQSIVYYLLRKAKGFSIDGHPVVRSLVETRLFLEKVRPIDKKLDYQIQKLLKAAKNTQKREADGKHEINVVDQNADDLLRYRPNPDMLVPKLTTTQGENAVYKPPKIASEQMDEILDDKISKQEKLAMRRDKEMLRRTKQSSYVKRVMDDLEGKPEEVTDSFGADSREMTRYKQQREKQEQQEENLFTRAPVSRADKKREKRLLRSNGLLGMTDGFEDEVRTLGFEDDGGPSSFKNASRGKKFNKHKRKR